jgi:type II secretory pathway component GspD/PulD (secretin)
MKRNYDARGRRRMKLLGGILGMTLAMASIGPNAWGQTRDGAAEKGGAVSDARVDSRPFQTFYLTNATQQNEANEILVALRNMLPPDVRIYLVPSQNAIAMRATSDELIMTQKILNDLDRPRKTYRLTYTITDIDGGRRVGTQHFSMIVVAGQRTVLKQGDKVPVATGSDTNGSDVKTQMTYLDVGMNFDATLDESANGVRLNSKVEQLSMAEEKSGVGAQDPIIRQTQIQSTSFLTAGKPLILGSLDILGSTRHVDIEVVMDLVK